MIRARWALGLAACALAGCGGGGSSTTKTTSVPDSMHLTSPAFTDGGRLPARFTCTGVGHSPPLSWTTPPAATRALAMVVVDPDAPGGDFTHWVAVLPAGLGALTEGGHVGAFQSRNSTGRPAYAPPCPPPGDPPHRYVFTLYALGKAAGLHSSTDPATARRTIEAAAIASGHIEARFSR